MNTDLNDGVGTPGTTSAALRDCDRIAFGADGVPKNCRCKPAPLLHLRSSAFICGFETRFSTGARRACAVHSRAMFKVFHVLLAALALIGPQLSKAASPEEPREPGEYLIVTGGVSLHVWEKWKAQPHDNWWANFVRASRIRIEQILQANPNQQITWLVYRPAYITRSRQDSRDYTSLITSVRDTFHVRLMWFDSTSQLLNYVNNGQPRDRVKINGLEFFGHSNKACFMFDYSNIIDSASKAWLHENDLTKIRRGIFTRD